MFAPTVWRSQTWIAERDTMKIIRIHNATLRLGYGGVRLLIDLMLGEQRAYPRCPDT